MSLSATQLFTINTLGSAKNYSTMYNYIAGEMIGNRITGASQDQIYWFQQAAKINAGDTSSPASVFIRSATVAGLTASGQPADAVAIQRISDGIAKNVYDDIARDGAIPDFSSQLNQDISGAIRLGGMTIGGWGGAFYFWNEPYTNSDGSKTTVGGAILASPVEREKYINGLATATDEALQKFGVTGLLSDPAFLPALGSGLKNMAFAALGYASQVLQEMGDQFAKYGSAAIQKLETELLRQSGWKISFTPSNTPGEGTFYVASGQLVFDDAIYNVNTQGEYQRSLGGGNLDIIDSNGQRFLVDGAGNKTAVQPNQTILLNDSGAASIAERTAQTGLATDPARPVVIFGDNGVTTRIDRTNGGQLIATTTSQTFDDGSRLETLSTPDGKMVQKSFDTDNQLTGAITDTPYTPDTTDAAHIITRVVVTTVDGQPVQITQQASAAALANGEQPGDFITTAVKINGEPAVNNNLIAKVIDDTYSSAKDIILARQAGELKHIIEAGDATNIDGTTASLVAVTGRVDWWEDPTIGNLASDATSLISALRGGKPCSQQKAFDQSYRYYKNRSCLRPYSLGYRPQTHPKTVKNCQEAEVNRTGKLKVAQKHPISSIKSAAGPMQMSTSSYEKNSV